MADGTVPYGPMARLDDGDSHQVFQTVQGRLGKGGTAGVEQHMVPGIHRDSMCYSFS